jgi:hypothetical protein
MIELASVIQDLRSELERAIVAGEGEELRFELGPIELEVTVGVERSTDTSGTVHFWVVEFGTDRKKDTTDTQRIKLSLTPRLNHGTQSAFVNGLAGAGEEE